MQRSRRRVYIDTTGLVLLPVTGERDFFTCPRSLREDDDSGYIKLSFQKDRHGYYLADVSRSVLPRSLNEKVTRVILSFLVRKPSMFDTFPRGKHHDSVEGWTIIVRRKLTPARKPILRVTVIHRSFDGNRNAYNRLMAGEMKELGVKRKRRKRPHRRRSRSSKRAKTIIDHVKRDKAIINNRAVVARTPKGLYRGHGCTCLVEKTGHPDKIRLKISGPDEGNFRIVVKDLLAGRLTLVEAHPRT